MDHLILFVLIVAIVKLYLLSGQYPDSKWAPAIRLTLLLCIVGFVLVTVHEAGRS